MENQETSQIDPVLDIMLKLVEDSRKLKPPIYQGTKQDQAVFNVRLVLTGMIIEGKLITEVEYCRELGSTLVESYLNPLIDLAFKQNSPMQTEFTELVREIRFGQADWKLDVSQSYTYMREAKMVLPTEHDLGLFHVASKDVISCEPIER